MFYRILIVFLFLISSSQLLWGQSKNDIISSIIDIYFQDQLDSENDDQIYHELEMMMQNPIDINEAEVNDFLKLPFLSISDVEHIITFRDSVGVIKNILDLLENKNIDELAVRLLTYFAYSDHFSLIDFESFSFDLRSRVFSPIETSRGYSEGKYLGNKFKLYNKSSILLNNKYRFNLVQEKDAGENKYLDFVSYSFELKETFTFDKIIIGDHSINFGHGLSSWLPFYRGSYSLHNYKPRQGTIIKPYVSSYENNFLRGLAAKYSTNPMDITLSISSKKIDANLDSNGLVTSFGYTGLHRTESEAQKQNTTKLTKLSSALDIRATENISIGLFSSINIFANSLDSNRKRKTLSNSLFINYRNSSINLSSETSIDNSKLSTLVHSEVKLAKATYFKTAFNYAQKRFGNYYSNSFFPNSNYSDSYNLFTGLKFSTSLGKLDLFLEYSHIPNGNRYTSETLNKEKINLYFFSRSFNNHKFNLKFTYSIQDEPSRGDRFYFVSNSKSLNTRFEYIFEKYNHVRLKTRLEHSSKKENVISETGLLIFQDVKYKVFKDLFCFIRFTYFDSDSYNSRIYAFENDVNGVISITPFYNEGYKWYFMIKYNILNELLLNCKYSQIIYFNKDFIGSGYNEISSNKLSQLTLQIDIHL